MLFQYKKRGVPADDEQAEALAQELGTTPMLAGLLISRGICTAQEARRFFSAGAETLRDPLGLADMDVAVARVRQALQRKEPIVVYGDYDVDGVCATSILVGYLREQGGDVDFYIPSRHTEGYGINKAALDRLKGKALLVTVDCGISNVEEVAHARSLGMDVIVTDHHECPAELPQVLAIVNPKRPGQSYGFAGLCGAGVALKLVQAMGGMDAVLPRMDLAALATVADIVPLVDENRAIVRLGLEQINAGERPGVAALVEVSGLKDRQIKAGNIAFGLAPRINAGGRMDFSRKSVEMLLTTDVEQARSVARELDDDNRERLAVEDAILTEAIEMVERDVDFVHGRAIVLYQPHWNTGVTGIVASRLVERYSRPTILFGDGEGACYGSGRSVPGVHLYRALVDCSRYFLRYGGHEQAAGCAILAEHIEPFRALLDAHLAENYPEDCFLPSRAYDGELEPGQVSLALAQELERMEPTGFGNPKPVFLLRQATLTGLSRTRDGKHLRIRFGGGEPLEGIAFRQGDNYDMLSHTSACDALIVPGVNEYLGVRRVQALVEHMRPPQSRRYTQAVVAGAGAAVQKALCGAVCADGDGTLTPWTQALEQLIAAMQRSYWGTLVLCHTQSAAAQVLQALEDADCLDRVYVGMGTVPQAQRRENAVVIAPDINALSIPRYEQVFLTDGPLVGAWAQQLNNIVRCIIMNVNHERTRLDELFRREALLELYRKAKERLASEQGPSSGDDWRWVGYDGLDDWLVEVGCRVFTELGLLEELDRAPWLIPVRQRTRSDLMQSGIYRRISACVMEV